MEIKAWEYNEFPEYTSDIHGIKTIKTYGNEIGVYNHHNIKYLEIDGVDLHLQILEPFTRNEPDKYYPCLVYVQGSAWMEQDVYKSIPMIANLAKKGFVIAVVEYRHSGIAAFPAQIQDAKNAIRFMKQYGKDYHVDTRNVFVGGSSSGGHVAMFCGIVKDEGPMDRNCFPGISAEIKGILDYYGAVSLMAEDAFPSTLEHHLPESPEGMLMGNVNLRENMELRKEASVETYLSDELSLPPVAIFHGTMDRTVNTKLSVDLYKQLKAYNKEVNLYLFQGADHGGAEFWTEEICQIAAKFMSDNKEQ